MFVPEEESQPRGKWEHARKEKRRATARYMDKDSCHCQWVIRSVGQWNIATFNFNPSSLLTSPTRSFIYTNTLRYTLSCVCASVYLSYRVNIVCIFYLFIFFFFILFTVRGQQWRQLHNISHSNIWQCMTINVIIKYRHTHTHNYKYKYKYIYKQFCDCAYIYLPICTWRIAHYIDKHYRVYLYTYIIYIEVLFFFSFSFLEVYVFIMCAHTNAHVVMAKMARGTADKRERERRMKKWNKKKNIHATRWAE